MEDGKGSYSISGVVLSSTQIPYLLSEADFLRLKSTAPITLGLALSLMGIIIAFIISDIIPTYISRYLLKDQTAVVNAAKIYTVILFSIVAVITYFIGKMFFTNDHKKVIKKIEKHFTENQSEPVYMSTKNNNSGDR